MGNKKKQGFGLEGIGISSIGDFTSLHDIQHVIYSEREERGGGGEIRVVSPDSLIYFCRTFLLFIEDLIVYGRPCYPRLPHQHIIPDCWMQGYE